MRIIALRPAGLAISFVALLAAAPGFAQDAPPIAALAPHVELTPAPAIAAPVTGPTPAIPVPAPPAPVPTVQAAPTPPAPGTAAARPVAVTPPKPKVVQTRPPAVKAAPPIQAKSAGLPPKSTSPTTPASVVSALPPEPIKLSDDPRPSLSPQTFTATLQAAERYRALADAGGWPRVPNEMALLKPGEAGPAVSALKKRLVVTGDMQAHELDGSSVFDEAVASGIRRFQARHGLEPTGVVGPRTLVHLNIPARMRAKQLEASAGRLMGSKFTFAERYVVVNIPGATVEAVERGVVARRYIAVVGRPERASPQVETRITSVNFNPTWTVPTSIIKKDIIPHVRKDPGYLAKMRIRLFDGQGQEVDPATIDWSTERAANYTLRQDAGADNSLGEIRLDMPNKHAVYMHDTPSKRLFARSLRAQSSGCVRVSGVKTLAAWLLETSPGPRGPGSSWTGMEIETAIAGGARIDARLAKSVPVAWVYMTGFASPDGSVHFRDDVYGLDEPKPAAVESPAPIADPAATSSIAPRKQAQQREPTGRL